MGKGKKNTGLKGVGHSDPAGVVGSSSNDSIETPDFEGHQVFGDMPERKKQQIGRSVVETTRVEVHIPDDKPQSSQVGGAVSLNSSASANDSISLGTDDTNVAQSGEGSKGSMRGDEENQEAKAGKEGNKSWVNLFKQNRQPSMGLELEPVNEENQDFVLLEEEDIQPLEKCWGFGLIGYVAGRFPGKKALLNCCERWGVQFTFSTHDSGWLIFKFQTEEDRNSVLANGPYFIFQRPLLLKIMPDLFDFGDEELSIFPVWVKLRNLPLELWNPTALAKILALVGKPIRTDHLTATRGSLSFARVLVEVDAAQELVREVMIKTSRGKAFMQHIEYETVPVFCSHCNIIGHTTKGCKVVKGRHKEGDGKQELGKQKEHKGRQEQVLFHKQQLVGNIHDEQKNVNSVEIVGGYDNPSKEAGVLKPGNSPNVEGNLFPDLQNPSFMEANPTQPSQKTKEPWQNADKGLPEVTDWSDDESLEDGVREDTNGHESSKAYEGDWEVHTNKKKIRRKKEAQLQRRDKEISKPGKAGDGKQNKDAKTFEGKVSSRKKI